MSIMLFNQYFLFFYQYYVNHIMEFVSIWQKLQFIVKMDIQDFLTLHAIIKLVLLSCILFEVRGNLGSMLMAYTVFAECYSFYMYLFDCF